MFAARRLRDRRIPNPQGPATTDTGLGAFLADSPGVGQVNPNYHWKEYETQANGKFLINGSGTWDSAMTKKMKSWSSWRRSRMVIFRCPA